MTESWKEDGTDPGEEVDPLFCWLAGGLDGWLLGGIHLPIVSLGNREPVIIEQFRIMWVVRFVLGC